MDPSTGDIGAGQHYDATALTRRTVGSAAWLIVARLTTKAFDFLTLLVVARMLGPADFGIIAIAMTSVTIVEAVFELPFYQVLVSQDRIERRDLDTAFTLAVIRGLLIAFALLAVAVPFARFYGDPRLVTLIAVLSLAPALRGMGSPRLVIFAKRLDYRRELGSEMFAKFVAFILASTAAWVWHDYRALMVATLTTPAVWIIATYALAPYRPRFSLASWRGFAHFMSWTTAAQLLSAFNWQCDRLLLGRFVGRAELGSFSLANDLSFIPEQALIKPVVRPLISVFALIRNDRERIAAAYLTTANVVLAIGTPVLLGLSLLADPAVRLTLGGKWLAAIPILQWLSLTLIPPLLTAPFSSLAMATGKPREVLHQAALEAANKLPLMLVGASLYGVAGAIAARGASAIITALIVLALIERMIGTPIHRQLATTWRTFVGAMVLAVLLLALRPILHGQAGFALCGLLIGVSLAGAAGYAVTLGALWHMSGRPAGLERTIFDRFMAAAIWREGRPGRHVPDEVTDAKIASGSCFAPLPRASSGPGPSSRR